MLKEEAPVHLRTKKYPKLWIFDRQVTRAVRETLMAGYRGYEFAELFLGKAMEQLDELAANFALENCLTRDELNRHLMGDAEMTM
jgi:hypothetical protein